MKLLAFLIVPLLLLAVQAACESLPWSLDTLSRVPQRFDPPEIFTRKYLDYLAKRNIQPVWYEGEPYQGRATRTFGWLGIPDSPPDRKLPAMLLVHGGGGTANWRWVEHWTKRGYVALAIDHCGYLPVKGPAHLKNHKGRVLNLRTEFSGPKPYGFDGLDQPVTDQWPYHAVSAIVLGHSLLRSLPQVDPDRTGLIGVSWGGYLTCLAVGVDDRFACAISVYGCGFLHERSVWMERQLKAMSETQRQRWAELWDPSSTLGRARLPMLWVTGTNDFAYWMPALMKSTALVKGPVTLAVRVRMKHGHAGGWEPNENYVFAASHLKGGKPLATITGQSCDGSTLRVQFESPVPLIKAELNYTTDAGRWPDRKWQRKGVDLKRSAGVGEMTLNLPADATAFFVNLFDERGCVVSGRMVTPDGVQSGAPARKSATR